MTNPSDMECTDLLKSLYDAIMGLGQGKQVVRIRFSEREVQYSQPQLGQLEKLYQAQWNLCGEEAGLPELTARGRPMRVIDGA